MSHIPTEKIAIIDFSKGELYVFPISQREEAKDFFKRKGFNESDLTWIRGDIKVNIENETDC